MKKEDIEHLATLARIELRGGEAEALTEDISSILEYVSTVNEVTAEASSEKRVGSLHTVMREDANPHEAGKHTEDLLSAAPDRAGQYVRVKKILDNE